MYEEQFFSLSTFVSTSSHSPFLLLHFGYTTFCIISKQLTALKDLPESVKSNIFLYADDTKILKQITSKEDALDLQSDIDSLEQWSNKWLLSFHPDKCHMLTLGEFHNIMYTQRYKING